ncbi:hypothetical protein BDZ88DRAFT_494390 [Geranomyces variabilis]|nr:hypothetical protein BDZ88DRAFT_494390 [Geranomyces variabilis]KAJ3142312.1 hypothetical protein HDU90_004585 [Geranomyces variabilis]
MPPKKKPGSAGGSKKGKGKEPASLEALEIAEKLVKTTTEVETLMRELAFQTSQNNALRAAMEEQRGRLTQLADQLERKAKDRQELTSDMARQYKSMQAEMAVKIGTLESQVGDLTDRLNATNAALAECGRERGAIVSEKNAALEDQQVKMSYMSSQFESMLSDTLSKMHRKLETVSNRWKENDSINLSDVNQRRLADFHLTRLTLGFSDEKAK